jgi:ribosomal protein S10
MEYDAHLHLLQVRRFLLRILSQTIRISLKAFDHKLIDQSAGEIVETAKRTGAQVKGPIPLPTKHERFTILTSTGTDTPSSVKTRVIPHLRPIRPNDIIKPSNFSSLNKLYFNVDARC